MVVPALPSSRRRPAAIASLAVALAVALTGCGGGDDDAEVAETPSAAKRGGDARQDGRRPDPGAVGDGRGGVALERVAELEQPVFVTQPPGERKDLYVVEQAGRVMRVPGGAGPADDAGEPEVFLDIGELVTDTGGYSEQGLLSVAFAPDYPRSGLLYVDYTDRQGDTRVVEYRRSKSDPDVADPASARELLSVDQPFANHNGGLLAFDPDGNLLVGLGDGGSGGDPDRNGQDLSTLLGKILRIDPSADGDRPYGIPADNPFADRAGARPEILAYGLRNPWRFSIDRQTGRLWIGDVGQDSLEEVDVTPRLGASANFGWSAFEGTERFNSDQRAPGHVRPVLTYGQDAGCSVTGGYVARDPKLPSLYGRYLYGDFCAGELRSFSAAPGGEVDDDRSLGLEVPALSSFGEDSVGRLYATSLDGPVYRLAPDG